jgi:hypothetical protein
MLNAISHFSLRGIFLAVFFIGSSAQANDRLNFLLFGTSPPADQALSKRYSDEMSNCSFQHVTELDDRISSAEVVGRAIFQQCTGENFALWESFLKRQGRAYAEGYSGAQLKWTYGLVLYVRAHPKEIAAAAKEKQDGLY